MEPTAAEAASMHSVRDIALWIPMAVDPFASLCQHLDLNPDEHYRTLAFMSSEWLQELLSQWRNELNQPVSPALMTQAGLLGRTAR
eukprot:3038377-Amphidinium_carterae.1